MEVLILLRSLIYISKFISNCSKHRIHYLAAAFAYYFILSIPPVLMLIFILSKKFLISTSILNTISPIIIRLFGENVFFYIIKLLDAISSNSSLPFYTTLSIVILIITSSSLFIFTKVSYSNYKNLSKKQNFFLGWIKTRLYAILLTLIVLCFYFIAIFLSPVIKKINIYFTTLNNFNTFRIYKYFLDYFIFPVIFSFIFSLYLQLIFEKIPIKYAFISGILTSFLGKIANILLFKWIPTTLAGSIFSKAGSSLIILLYIYYIGLVIFIGFEFAVTMWESAKFHRSYKWVTKQHFDRLYKFNKYKIQKNLLIKK